MSLKETKPNDEPNYAARFGWAVAAILLTMAVMGIATDKFG